MSLPLPLVAVFLLQSVRVMHISRPQWRRKKQLTSTTTRSSSSAPRPRPTTVPSPRPLNRDSAKAGKRTHTSQRRERSSLARLDFRWSARSGGERAQARCENSGPSQTVCIVEQHPAPDTSPTPTFQNDRKVDEFLGSLLDQFQYPGRPRNLLPRVSSAEGLYYHWNSTELPPETNQFQQEIIWFIKFTK